MLGLERPQIFFGQNDGARRRGTAGRRIIIAARCEERVVRSSVLAKWNDGSRRRRL